MGILPALTQSLLAKYIILSTIPTKCGFFFVYFLFFERIKCLSRQIYIFVGMKVSRRTGVWVRRVQEVAARQGPWSPASGSGRGEHAVVAANELRRRVHQLAKQTQEVAAAHVGQVEHQRVPVALAVLGTDVVQVNLWGGYGRPWDCLCNGGLLRRIRYPGHWGKVRYSCDRKSQEMGPKDCIQYRVKYLLINRQPLIQQYM